MPGKRKAKAKLEDIEVKEVSVVDRAANGKKWLIRKNEDGAPAGDQPADPTAASAAAADPPAIPATDPAATPTPDPASPAPPAAEPAPPVDQAPAPEAAATPAEGAPTEVAKRGRMKKWLDKVKAKHAATGDVLRELEADLATEADDDRSDTDKRASSEDAKAALAKAATLEETVKRLEGELAASKAELVSAKATITKQAGVIADAKLAAVGNSEPDEGRNVGETFVWPRDMAQKPKATARQ